MRARDGTSLLPGSDPSIAIAAWRSHFAEQNLAPRKRALRTATGWIVFVGVLGRSLSLITLWAPPTPLAFVAGVVGIVAVVLAAVAGVYASSLPFRREATSSGLPVRDVVTLHPAVAEWADDATPLDELWDFAVAVDRDDQTQRALDSWREGSWDEEGHGSRPGRLIDDVVTPALDAQLTLEVARLDEVVARLGFDAPERLRGAKAPAAD